MNKRQRIEEAVLAMIEQNIIPPGARVPSIRKMSDIYKVSVAPVIEAYRNLEMRGILESRPKSGFIVVPGSETQKPLKFPEIPNPKQQLFSGGNDLKLEHYYSHECAELDILYPYGTESPVPALCAADQVLRFLARASRDCQSAGSLMYSGCDDTLLVNELAKWMMLGQCIVSTEEILVTTSPHASLLLALTACTRGRDAVAIASPGPQDHYLAVGLKHLCPVPIPSSPAQGLDVEYLRQAIRTNPSLKCVVCSPNWSSPTGALMPQKSREALAQLCLAHDITIIEDDRCSALGHTGQRPAPLKNLIPDHVIYLAQIPIPGFALNWVCGGKHHGAIRDGRNTMLLTLPCYLQRGLGEFMASGLLRTCLKQARLQCKSAVAAARRAIAQSFPEGTQSTAPSGGCDLWVSLPNGCSAEDLFRAARVHKISFSPGQLYSATGENLNCFRLNCSILANSPKSTDGLLKLGQLARELAAVRSCGPTHIHATAKPQTLFSPRPAGSPYRPSGYTSLSHS